MQRAMASSARGQGTFNALRQADGLNPLAVAKAVSVVPFFRTEALMSSGCMWRFRRSELFTIVNVSPSEGFVSSAEEKEPMVATAFAERLQAAVGGTPQAVVAKRAGISVGAMNKYLSGSEPGAFKAARLAQVLGVDLVWLLTGRGAPTSLNGFVNIPIYDVRFAAGVASFSDAAEQIGTMPFGKDLLRSLGLTGEEELGVFGSEGDSMVPTVQDGGSILVNLRDTRLREGVFAFRTDDDLRIKRLRRTVDGIEIISDNDRYAPELVTGDAADELKIIGRVRWTGGPI